MPKIKSTKPLQRSSLGRSYAGTVKQDNVGKSSSSTKIIQEIKEKEASIASSLKNVNGLVEMMESHAKLVKLDSPNQDAILHAYTSSLRRLFNKWHDQGLLKRTRHEDAEAKVATWLRERYIEFTNQVLDQLHSKEAAIQVIAIKTLFDFLQRDSLAGKVSEDQGHFDNTSYLRILTKLFHENPSVAVTPSQEHVDHASKNFEIIVDTLKEWVNKYDDVLLNTYRVLSKLCQNLTTSKSKTLPFTVENLHSFLTQIRSPPSRRDDVDQEEDEEFEKDANVWIDGTPPTSIRTLRSSFTSAWITLLTKLPLTPTIYRQTLTTMHKSIMPKIIKPEMILDFLIQAYDSVDGQLDSSLDPTLQLTMEKDVMIPILALSSLFYLIQSRNLDYPDFFQKLYALLSLPQIYRSRYRSRLFRLVDTFLSSTHLPATLVAGFVKRLSRMSLSAPPPALLFLIPLCFNLIKRHPSCIVMVHRGDTNPELRGFKGQDDASGQYSTDPYNHTESNPQICHALDSSIWELVSLQRHVNPQVARLAKVFEGKMNQPEFQLEDVLDESWNSMFEGEVKAARRKYALGVSSNKSSELPLESSKGHLFPGLKDGDGAWNGWASLE